MNLEGLRFIRLASDHIIKPFDCGDPDLNDFLLNDAKLYQGQLLTVTYLIESDTETVAFFSLLNDKISVIEANDKKVWNRIRRKIPYTKHKSSFPAMKIARLGVSNAHKGQSIGTGILDYLKQLFIDNNRTGCRFITVDAYRKALSFYERNGFDYLTTQDVEQDTRLMYFDLSTIA